MAEVFKRCWACMEPLSEEQVCPRCHFDKSKYQSNPRCLRLGTVLNHRYFVGRVLGEGGFGITYIGWDQVLDMTVAIKEYFPSGIASRDTTSGLSDRINVFEGKAEKTYQDGLRKYVNEAKNLSKFHELHGIVSIRDFFYENETAYIIMEYIRGMTLKQYIREFGKLKPENVFQVMKPVMRSLEKIHQSGMIHRDISPDNIMITKEGGMKLIDFGAARVTNDSDNKSFTVMLKRGFAPEEQYRSKGQQGAWTDVYAISATIYYMITGKVPPEAMERVIEDSIEDFHSLGIQIPLHQKRAVMKGLAVLRQQRYQSIHEMYIDIYDKETTGAILQDELEEREQEEIEQVIEHSIRKSEEISKEKGLSELSEETVLADVPESTGIGETVLADVPESTGIGETVLVDMQVSHQSDNSQHTSTWKRPSVSQQASQKRESKKKFFIPVIATLVIVGSVVFALGVKNMDTKGGQETPTPLLQFTMVDVLKETKDTASELIQKIGDDKLKIKYSYAYSDSAKKGIVIKQSISAGESYTQGENTEITLTVSKGSEPVSVPQILGKTKEKAITLIHKADLKYEIVGYKYSSTYGRGKIMKQEPSANKKVKKGTMVKFVVSEGVKPIVTRKPRKTWRPVVAPTKAPAVSRSTPKPPRPTKRTNPIGDDPKRPNPIG